MYDNVSFSSVFQAVLQTCRQLELEIRPLFLVPDTNGFIDHLPGLQSLLACGLYILVVPLIGQPQGRPLPTPSYLSFLSSLDLKRNVFLFPVLSEICAPPVPRSLLSHNRPCRIVICLLPSRRPICSTALAVVPSDGDASR